MNGSTVPPVAEQEGSPPELGVAVVRTITPFITAALVAKTAQWGLNVSSEEINNGVVTLGGSVWYVFVRILEQKWPKAGWLLGSPKQPNYNR
jgi:hypothetical protein